MPLSESWATNPKREVLFSYDETGQLSGVRDPDSQLGFTYDTVGRKATVDNAGTPGVPHVSFTYKYDDDGNLISAMDNLGGVTEYRYDQLDRLSSITQSGSRVGTKRVDFLYDPSGLLQEVQRSADLDASTSIATTTFEYECGGCVDRPRKIQHVSSKTGKVLDEFEIEYDSRGDVKNLTELAGIHHYNYDRLGRLLSADHPGGESLPNEFYVYDSAGNRLSSHLSSSYTYSYQSGQGSNRLIMDSRYRYDYDAEGNLFRRTDIVTGASSEYVYDFHNRLTSIVQRATQTSPPTRSISLTYDAGDRLISLRDGGDSQSWAYDDFNPALHFDSTGSMSRRLYGRDADAFFAEEVSGQTKWALTDQVGSVREVVQNNGLVVGKRVYDSFGNVVAAKAEPNGPSFTSRDFLETGLGYFRLRYYDPSIGRFTQEDPSEPHSYDYALNNPLLFTDPMGADALAEDTEIQQNVEAGEPLPCENHHIFPKYAVGHDLKVFWRVTQRSHREFHSFLYQALPRGANLPLEVVDEILELAYDLFPLEPCPGTEALKFVFK